MDDLLRRSATGRSDHDCHENTDDTVATPACLVRPVPTHHTHLRHRHRSNISANHDPPPHVGVRTRAVRSSRAASATPRQHGRANFSTPIVGDRAESSPSHLSPPHDSHLASYRTNRIVGECLLCQASRPVTFPLPGPVYIGAPTGLVVARLTTAPRGDGGLRYAAASSPSARLAASMKSSREIGFWRET